MRRSSDNTRRIASVVKMSRRIVESSAVAGMSPPVRDLTAFLRATGPQPCHVMAGLVPAIHVFDQRSETWTPGIADKFTQSAQACLRAGHDDGKIGKTARNVQSPWPGLEENSCSLLGFPSHSLASSGGSRLTVILGHTLANSAFRPSHFSNPGSVSGLMASTGHSGSHTPQSMHSSG